MTSSMAGIKTSRPISRWGILQYLCPGYDDPSSSLLVGYSLVFINTVFLSLSPRLGMVASACESYLPCLSSPRPAVGLGRS
jgi:hypothetical protein